MRKLSNLLAALVFVSLVIFVSCGSDDGGGGQPDPLEVQAGLLQNTWTANASQVVYNNGNPDVSWDGFQLTISGASSAGGDYSTGGTTPTDFESVWPASGTWTFDDGSSTELLRNDGVVMTVVSVSETALTLRFDVTDPNIRTSGVGGSWQFTFSAN